MSTTTPPGGTEPNILREKVKDMLDGNGKIPEEQRWKLMIGLLDNVDKKLDDLMSLPREISTLKKKNLIILCEKHPKVATLILLPVSIVFIIHFIEYLPTIERALEVVAKWLL